MIQYITVLSFILCFNLFGCNGYSMRGSGIIKDEQRDIRNFKEIEVAGAYDVVIRYGESYKLQVIGDDNLLQYVKTEVKDNVLYIDSERDMSIRQRIKILIHTPQLEEVSTSGASNIRVMNFAGKKLQISAAGAGNIYLEGNSEELLVDLSGAVNLKAQKLAAKNVKVEISGASNAEVFSQTALKADISGVGSIVYHGSPEFVKKSISGLGSIRQK